MYKKVGIKTGFILVVILFSVILFVEYKLKETSYLEEKLYDVNIQYSSAFKSTKDKVELLLDTILKDDVVISLYQKISGEEKDLDDIRNSLYYILLSRYNYMKEKGVLQLHFHLPNGDSFLRMHNPKEYGDNLLDYRKTVEKVIKNKEPVIAFELGKFFECFRYVFPIIDKSKYLGSLEVSIKSEEFLNSMSRYFDSKYLMILDKDRVEEVVDKNFIEKNYHLHEIAKGYYVSNKINIDNKFKINSKKIAYSLKRNLKAEKSFVDYKLNIFDESYIYVFKNIKDYKNNHIGYLVSLKQDNTLNYIIQMTLLRFFFFLFLLYIIYHFLIKNRKNKVYLEQFKSFVDKTTLVSRTDKSGKIIDANDSFIKLSGYSKSELIGQPHNIVRHKDSSKKTFKDMWNTIKKGKNWRGTIKNRKKDGSSYIVDVNVFPIFNEEGHIEEYIALRHDITELENYRELLQEQLKNKTDTLDETLFLIKQYEDAIDSSTALFRFDNNNVLSYVNDKLLSITGKDSSSLIGKEFMGIMHENGEYLKDNIQRIITKNGLWRGIIDCKKTDMSNCYLSASILPIRDLKGNIREYMAISYDITNEFKLIKEIEETQKEVVFTMGSIGESRSKETGAHVKRVAAYSYLLAILYGCEKSEAELLKQASPMHDIGKVGIPDSILNKPGKLDNSEWKIMKTHAELGYEMLKHSKREILKTAAIVAYEHHEKWDGSGYPRGLSKENIHIYGRITAIADVFDALGHDRVYKKAWEIDDILELFKNESGKQFDPNLIKLFFDNLDKFLELRKEVGD